MGDEKMQMGSFGDSVQHLGLHEPTVYIKFRSVIDLVDLTYPLACLYGLIVLTAFVGWGEGVGKVLQIPRQKNILQQGMKAAIGMAVFICQSGFLLVFGLFSKLFILTFLGLGIAIVAWKAYCGQYTISIQWARHRALWIVGISLVILVLLSYLSAAARHDFNTCDDFAAYFTFPKIMLDTGTFIDPFSHRRMSALGGQSALQAIIMCVLPWKYGHFLDCGIALVIMSWITCELLSGDSFQACHARLWLVLLALTYPVGRINTTSELTGVVLILALLKCMDAMTLDSSPKWKWAIVLSLLSVATATLRTQNLYAVVLLGLVYIAWRICENHSEWKSLLHLAWRTIFCSFLLLTPWLVLSQLSSKTLLYPLLRGVQRPDYQVYDGGLTLLQSAVFMGTFFLTSGYLIFYYPIFMLPRGRTRRWMGCVAGVLLLVSVVLMSHLTSSTYGAFYRYLSPLGIGLFLTAAGIAMKSRQNVDGNKQRPGAGIRNILICTTLPLLAIYHTIPLVPTYIGEWKNIIFSLHTKYEFSTPDGLINTIEPIERDYRHAEACLPIGTKTLAVVDYPFLLDFRKYRFYNIDQAGAASPDPGMPYFRGPEELRRYLVGQGIHYIVYTPFDHSTYLHSREKQKGNRDGVVQLYKSLSRYELDFMDNVDELALKNKFLYRSDLVCLIAL